MWKKEGMPLSTEITKSSSSIVLEKTGVDNLVPRNEILRLIQDDNVDQSKIIIDARSKDRFTGKSPEPRPGLLSGHIPTSVNIPFPSLLQTISGVKCFASKGEQKHVFESCGVDFNREEYIFTCGSGVTACIPLLCLVENFDVPFHKCRVYDGSFSDWGKPELELPIQQG